MRPSRLPAALAVLAALTAFAAPSDAAPRNKAKGKPKPDLRVTQVASPSPNAGPGGAFTVSGKVRNAGKRRGTARIAIVLRSQAGDIQAGSSSVKVNKGVKRGFTFEAVVPNGTAPGEYPMSACARKLGNKGPSRCTAGGAFVVTGPGVPIEGTPVPKEYTPGARSLGDPLFPQTGNGGYDAQSYDIELEYDPVLNDFPSATTTMTATATQDLSRFSLDFQDLDVSAVTVNGAPASFTQELAEPPLGDPNDVTQLRKLTVTPATPIDSGSTIVVEVDYSGTPVRLTDIDSSYEGWIPACYGPNQTPPCDGGFVVNEPNGAQAWFPNNNYPTDKATFDTTITVPVTHTALGVGELASRIDNGDGTWTWSWSEDTPMSTYLTTATVGLFNYSLTSMIETSTSRALPIYNAVDSSYVPPASTNLATSLEDTDEQLNYLSALFGPYPLDSYGSVVDRTTDVGYALEVQTKSHYAQIGTTSQDINSSTQLHETAHQWMGNTVTLERWTDIWLQEGAANWSEWIWGFDENGGDSPEVIFDDLYADTPDAEWEIAPAVLDGDPVNLFAFFPTYERGAMTIQATREIIGQAAFETLLDRLLTDYRYGNISTQEFIALAEEVSGFSGADLALLDDFFDQWLYGEVKPTILPEDF